MRELTVVAGAAGSLGRAVVEVLAAGTTTVVAVGRPGFEEVAEPTSGKRGAVVQLGADLIDPDSVASLWRRIDGLGEVVAAVNLVGGFQVGTVADTTWPTYRESLQVNLDSAWLACREAAPRLAQRGAGAIVNVSSRAARVAGAQSAAYAVAKAGVVRLTEVLAAELAPHRVRVNAVLPSVIDTPSNRDRLGGDSTRAVPPQAIARVIAFLLGPDGWPISGGAIPVYGWS